MSKNEKSTFSSNSGSMFHIFLETKLIEMIKHIQKNENLKDEGDVIAHLIQDYGKKNITQLDQFEKKWKVENSKFEPNDDKFRKYYYSQQRTWLNHIKSNLT